MIKLKDFGPSYRVSRKESGVSMQDVKNSTGISIDRLRKIEKGERPPDLDEVAKLCAMIGLIAELQIKREGD